MIVGTYLNRCKSTGIRTKCQVIERNRSKQKQEYYFDFQYYSLKRKIIFKYPKRIGRIKSKEKEKSFSIFEKMNLDFDEDIV
jgi:hypothetical protein